jgi:1,4-alpha-glucan branching enzyme
VDGLQRLGGEHHQLPFYRELLNTDATVYGGGNVGNAGGVLAEELPYHGQPFSLRLTLPPLATLVFAPEG